MRTASTYLALALVGLALFFANPIVELASRYNLEVAVGGTAVYASLRGISSAMSIVRDADVQVAVPLASFTTSPGQALQPVIETIERMANLLFALVLASGVIGFTLPIVASLGALVLAVGAALRAVLAALGRPLFGPVGRLLRAAVTLGLLSSVLIPTAYAFGFILGDRYTAAAWNSAADVFATQADSISAEGITGPVVLPEPEPEPEAPPAPEGEAAGGDNLLDWAQQMVGGAIADSSQAVQNAISATTGFATAVTSQIAASASLVTDGLSMAGDLFQASVDIGVSYLVKLIVLPLVILAGMLWLCRSALEPVRPLLYQTGPALIPPPDSRPARDPHAPEPPLR